MRVIQLRVWAIMLRSRLEALAIAAGFAFGVWALFAFSHVDDPVVRWFPLILIAMPVAYAAEQIYPGWHGLSEETDPSDS